MAKSPIAIVLALAVLLVSGPPPVAAQTESPLTVVFDASIAAAFLDPAQTGDGSKREALVHQLYFAGPYEDLRLRRP